MGKVLRFTAVGILAAAVAAVVPGHAQQPATAQAQQPTSGQDQPAPDANTPAPDAQQPIFRAGVNFVRVDVIVTDRSGNPVGDLKPEDFEITEQGQAQSVETFKLISLDGGRVAAATQAPRQIRTDLDEETEAARDDVRLFGIFLDDYHVRLESGIQTREQLARFIETQLGPSDMVGLMYPLQPMDSVRFTRNHDAVIKGLLDFRGRKYNYQPRNDFEQRYANYPAEMVEKIRNQVSMSALKALTMRMGGLKEGRKALILVSEGYTNMLPPQLRDPVASAPGMGNLARFDPDAGLGQIEGRAAFVANADLEMDMRNVYDTANRNNVSIYAVDPRRLAAQEFDIGQNVMQGVDREYLNYTMNTLRTLAFNTDGRAIVNQNDLITGMRQIVRDNSAYYLLGYNSTFTATDGKFHEIKVRVKRPGVQVRARRGYWAFTAADAEIATAPPKPEPPKAVETIINTLNMPPRSRLVRTWIGLDRGASGKTRVTLVWEPMPRTVGAPVRPDEVPARMSLTAIAPDGSPYFRGRLPDSAPVGGATGGGAVSFEAAPGKVQMRLAVESAGAEVLDSEVREMDIPDLTAAATAIGTPEVYRARTPRDFQQLKIDPKATPTASREFSRTERLLIRVPTYGSGDAAPEVTAKLLNRTGQPIADLPVVPSVVRAESARDVEVTLNTYPPGEYLVEITLAGSGEPIKELSSVSASRADMRQVLAMAAILAACASPLGAASDPVVLDIIVESTGRQAPLAAADFQVSDADGPLAIDSVELASLTSDADRDLRPPPIRSSEDEEGAARGAARLFAIFIDEFHLSETGEFASTRAALARFVRTSLGPRDLLVVLKPLESLTAIRMTRDREAAAQAIESARGRAGDYTARTPFEQQFLAGTAERIDESRAQISLSALSALAGHVGHLPGARKTLITVSDGFTLRSPGRRGAMPGFTGVSRTATLGRVAVYVVHAMPGDAVSAGSPTGSDTAEPDGRSALRRLSEETTGFTIVASSGLTDDLGRVLHEASRYYVVKVHPRTDDSEAFRPVTVSVQRQDTVVRARAGFSLAPPPAAIGARTRLPPPPLNVPRRTSQLIRAWFGLSSAGSDRTRVSFVWEPASRTLTGGARRADPETVSMQVTTLSGEPVFSGRVGAAGTLVVPSGQASRLSFDTEAGRLLVQMEILDAAGRVLDRDVRDLMVARFQAPVALGTPEVLRVRTARDLRPLLAGEDGVPTVSREFSRADHLVIRVPVIGDLSEVRAMLASGFGGAMRDLDVTRMASDPTVAQLDLSLAGLATGNYVVRVNATSAGGRAADRVAFTIRP